MHLPNREQAIVELGKLRDYCLNADHPTGKNKARVFASALGMTARDAERLREMILAAADTEEAVLAGKDQHGQRYPLDFVALGLTGSVTIRSTWIVGVEESLPRLTSCYVISR